MKLGKVSDTILSRSVLKPLNTVRGQKVTRMDIGQDGMCLRWILESMAWIRHC